MAIVRLARTVDAPPSEVFGWVADYRNAPSFIDGLEPLRPSGGSGSSSSSSYEAVLHFGPRRLEATISLLEAQPDRLVTWSISSDQSQSLSFRFSEVAGVAGGTSVDLVVTYERPGGFAGALTGPVIDQAIRRLAKKALDSIARSVGRDDGRTSG